MTRIRAAVAAALLAALLAACAPPLPTPEPDAVPAVVPAAVSTTQVESVLAEVAHTLATADEAMSPDALEPRVGGPAKTIREVQYLLAGAGQEGAVTEIPPAAQTIIAPATETWPRTVMVVTEAPESLQPPLLLTMVQESPREQFTLWSWVRLFPGTQMPATAQPTIGSEPVPPDAQTLAVAPGEVVGQYVDLLTNGAESQHAGVFEDDPLRTGITGTRDAFAALVNEMGSLTETYQPLDQGPYAIETADGGAIVVGAFQTVTTISLVDSTLTIGDQTAALLGKDTVTTSLAITWLSVVAFAVPPADSTEPIRVLGAEHSRIQVSGE